VILTVDLKTAKAVHVALNERAQIERDFQENYSHHKGHKGTEFSLNQFQKYSYVKAVCCFLAGPLPF
jgi:hypothetical protein